MTASRGVTVIILAAGRGSRLGSLATDRPKIMVELEGRTLLSHQIATLRASGISEIHIVLGHGADFVRQHPDAQGLTCWENPDHRTTNMVASLLCANGPLRADTDLLVAYGDLVYEHRLVAALRSSSAPISVVVDVAWRAYWQARMPDPLKDAETLRVDPAGRILELGGKPSSLEDIQGQYTGLIYITADAVPILLRAAKQLVAANPRAYMTELLQGLIDVGHEVRAVPVRNGWLEIDRPEDLEIDTSRFWRPESA